MSRVEEARELKKYNSSNNVSRGGYEYIGGYNDEEDVLDKILDRLCSDISCNKMQSNNEETCGPSGGHPGVLLIGGNDTTEESIIVESQEEYISPVIVTPEPYKCNKSNNVKTDSYETVVKFIKNYIQSINDKSFKTNE